MGEIESVEALEIGLDQPPSLSEPPDEAEDSPELPIP